MVWWWAKRSRIQLRLAQGTVPEVSGSGGLAAGCVCATTWLSMECCTGAAVAQALEGPAEEGCSLECLACEDEYEVRPKK